MVLARPLRPPASLTAESGGTDVGSRAGGREIYGRLTVGMGRAGGELTSRPTLSPAWWLCAPLIGLQLGGLGSFINPQLGVEGPVEQLNGGATRRQHVRYLCPDR